MRIQTSQNSELFARALRTVVLGVFAVFASVLFAAGVSLLRPTTTTAATSSTINFQARLETSAGAVAPDGTYNVSFHLFSASSAVGGTSTDTGCGTDTSCEWTEQYTYNSGAGASDARIRVVNGYLTVNLGSLTAFSGINWNQQQWLTMDIGGTVGSGTITWDGQMSPRLLLTATPYAFQAGGLSVTSGSNTDSLVMTAPASASHTITVPDETGTICTTAGSTACTSVYAPASGGSSYVQLQATTPGTAQTGNFNISGTGIAGTLQASTVDTASAVALGIGTTNATQINLNQNTVVASGKLLTVNYIQAGVLTPLTIVANGTSTWSTTTGTLTLQGASGLNLATAAGTTSSSITLQTGNASAGASGNITIDNGTATLGSPSISIGTTNARSITIGSTTGSTATTLQAGTGNINFLTNSSSASIIAKSNTNSTTAFQVQNANSQQVLGVNTSGSNVNLGAGSTLNGALVFNNAANNNTITLTTGATASNYSLTLPTATPAAGLCLQTSTASASQLVFASCANTNASISEVNEWDEHGANTLSDAPANLGDVLVLGTKESTSGVSVSSISGGGVSTWTKIIANSGNATVNQVELWMGVVTTTGSSTITVTYSGSPGSQEIAAMEFTAAGVTANTAWGVDTSGGQLNSAPSTTVTYPSLVSEGNAEVYVGYAMVQNNGQAGSTSGFSYALTGLANILTYATPTVANTTYQPTASQNSSGQSNAVGVILTAFINSTAINNSTSLQKANFYVQAASSGTVAGTLQANASGTGDILDLKNGSGTNVASFGNTGNTLFAASANAINAFQVQNSTGANLLTVDTSNTAIVLGNDGTPSALTVRGGTATGTNVAGGTITIDASNGTGNAGSGDLIFRTAAGSGGPGGSPTFDSSAFVHQAPTPSNPVTWSHTTTTQSSRIMIVTIAWGSIGISASSVTYGGQPLSRVTANVTCSASNCIDEMWYMVNPPTGTNTVSVTWTGSAEPIVAGSSTYYNVNTSSPFGTIATATGHSAGFSNSLTTSTNQLVVDAIAGTGNNDIRASAGQTELYWDDTSNNGASSYMVASGTSTTMSWTDLSTDYWAWIAAPINPAPSGGSTADTLTDRLHITAAGNVGINTATPQYTLDVAGTARVQTPTNSTTAFLIQNASGTSLLTADTANLVLTVAGSTSAFATLMLNNAHFSVSQTTAPTIGTPTSCATSPSASITAGSADSAGSFTITSGSGTQTNTCQVVITFNKAYGTAPKSVVLTGSSANATKEGAAVTATSTTTFTVVLPNTTTASTAYRFYYWVIQ